MKTITFTTIAILLAASLFGKKPAPPPPDTQPGWHVSIFSTMAASAQGIYQVGDDYCLTTSDSVRCGISFSSRLFLLANGHIIDRLFDAENYIRQNSAEHMGRMSTEYDTYSFLYRLESFQTQDILGRPITKQRLTFYMQGLRPLSKDSPYKTGIDSEFKGGFTITIGDWHQASHDLTMSDIAADIHACDDWHQKYGTACPEEAVMKTLRQFITQTPALSLIDPVFAKHDQYLSHFIH